MRRLLLLTAIVIGIPVCLFAQDDDMYFFPKKQTKEQRATQNTYYIGTDRSVDEYNRRGKFRSKVEPLDGDIIAFDGVEGVYPDSSFVDTLFVGRYEAPRSYNYQGYDDDDYTYSRQIDRWYGCYDPWFYGYTWRWHSPFWYGYHSAFYDPWMWYDPWYDPFYYGYGWHHFGWYDPWYTAWYYPWHWGIGYPWNPGHWGGAHGGSHGDHDLATAGRRGSAPMGGAATASGGVGRRGGTTFHQIAQRQDPMTRTTGTVSRTQRQTGQRQDYRTAQQYHQTQTYTQPHTAGSPMGGSTGGFSGGGFGGGSRGGGAAGGGGHSGRR